MDAAIKDDFSYRRYTTKSELDKAIHTLEGILKGIAIDGKINVMEIEELQNWCNLYRKYESKNPFNELIPLVDNAIQDGVLSEAEVEDIFWLCNNLKTDSKYYGLITSDIQRLQGMLHGILSDNRINDEEIHGLKAWLDENEHLAGSYPYDEVYSLLIGVLADGKVDDRERAELKAFFAEFIDIKESYNLDQNEITKLKAILKVGGICSTCPEIKVIGKKFCFTGTSGRHPRAAIQAIIENNGGLFHNNIVSDTDYLIVGNDGNQCWAFSCYGRKVEKAMDLRKSGHSILIVHENDFWDAIEDIG